MAQPLARTRPCVTVTAPAETKHTGSGVVNGIPEAARKRSFLRPVDA